MAKKSKKAGKSKPRETGIIIELRKALQAIANPPQVLAPLPRPVCSRCGSLDSFVVYKTHGHVQYLKCSHCGKTATRRVL